MTSKLFFFIIFFIKKKIREVKVVYVDETEIKVDGVTYHLWTFVTETETLFAIRKSRGNDCNLQRCWAHLLREAKYLAEKYSSFVGFYEAIKGIFKKIKKLRGKPYSLNSESLVRK